MSVYACVSNVLKIPFLPVGFNHIVIHAHAKSRDFQLTVFHKSSTFKCIFWCKNVVSLAKHLQKIPSIPILRIFQRKTQKRLLDQIRT
jgi:hypothetical protein